MAFAEPLSALAADRIHRVSEAATRGLQRAQLAQPMRMALHRQIQRRVGGMEVPDPRRPICHPFHRHRPEHRLHGPSVPTLDPTARHALIADDLLKALLAHRPQRQMIIQQPAQQLPALTVKTLFQFGMREPSSVCPIQKAHQRLKLLSA